MNVVITGSNGFIGKNLIEYIGNNIKNAKIHCLVRGKNTKKNTLCIDYEDIEQIKSIEILKHADYVIHLAGVTKGISRKDFLKGNVIPTENLLKSLQDNKNLKRFVFVSSLAACGVSDIVKNENEKAIPIEFYGESKLLAENIVNKYNNIKTTIIRPSAVYGPHDADFLKIFKMIKSNFLIYHQNKNYKISTIFVDDLIKGIIESMFSDNTIGKTYFLTNDVTTWENLYKIVFKLLKKNPIIINIPFFFLKILGFIFENFSKITKKPYILNSQKIKMANQHWVCSNEKAKKDFNFDPIVNIKEGLEITYQWYKKNKKI